MIPGIVASGFVEVATGPTFRSASSTTTFTGSESLSFTLPIPTGVVAGDLLIVQMYINADFKSFSAGTAPAGWTERGKEDDVNYPWLPWRTYSRIATGSDSFVWTGGNNWFTLAAAMIAVSGATAVDVVGTRAVSATAASVTTTTSPTLLVGLFAVLESAIAAPASMTSRINVASSVGGSRALVIATEALAASGATGTRVCPTSSISVRYSQLIAVK
jgi:hypothetical protein